MSFLEVSNISLSVSGKSILNSITIKVRKGEVFCICGESGAGKTTLLKIIAGLEEPDAGSISLNNTPVTGPLQNLVPGHADIVMVFQDTQLSPNRTIEENIAWELRSYPNDFQMERTRELLEKWQLKELRKLLPREVSGGEKQKTALARAMAKNPLLLLLDEPFSNMDFLLKNELREQLLAITKEEDITTIFVTHDTKEALSVAERIAVLKEGIIIQTDSPKAIYNHPASVYTASFFGAENLIEAEYLKPYFDIGEDTKEAAIRAEDISITGNKNNITGKVVNSIYYGSYQLLNVQIDHNLTLKAAVDKDRNFKVNERINLYLPKEKIILF